MNSTNLILTRATDNEFSKFDFDDDENDELDDFSVCNTEDDDDDDDPLRWNPLYIPFYSAIADFSKRFPRPI